MVDSPLSPTRLSLRVPSSLKRLDRFMRIDRLIKAVDHQSMRFPHQRLYDTKWAHFATKQFLRLARQLMSSKGFGQRIVKLPENRDEIEIEFYDRRNKKSVLGFRVSSDYVWLFDVFRNGVPLPLMVMNSQTRNTPQQGIPLSMTKDGFAYHGELTPTEGRMYLWNWRRILHYINSTF